MSRRSGRNGVGCLGAILMFFLGLFSGLIKDANRRKKW